MRHIGALLAGLVFMVASGMAFGQPANQDRPDAEDWVNTAIRDFIMRNPKIIRESLANGEIAEQAERTKVILREQRDAIYRSGSPTLGAVAAKISIVEFFNYNCPYCRKTHPLLMQFLEANPDVQIVLKDIGSQGKATEGISKLAIAARNQGKFAPFHEALMRRQGLITEAVAIEIARKLGLDLDRLKKDAAAPETLREVENITDLAARLSVEGTPLFIIGHNGIAGAPDDWLAQLEKFVGAVRKSGCDVC